MIDHRRQCRDVYFKSIGRGRGRGWNDRGTKRNHPRSTGFLSSRSNFHFNQRRARVGHNPEGRNGLKQFLRSKQIFYRYSKPVCTFEREFYFRVSLLERGKRRGRGERERWGTKGATGILFSLLCPPPPSPPLHFIVSTIGQRTVLKWISIFPGVDLIKRGPDFRDGNIAGMHEN